MILTDIRQYLSDRKRAGLDDLCIRFETQPDAMRAMLSRWMDKGSVRLIPANSTCGAASCCGCAKGDVELYEWVDISRTRGADAPAMMR